MQGTTGRHAVALHAGVGAATGAAATLIIQLGGNGPGIDIGVGPGLNVATVLPGLLFGVVFGTMWWARGAARPGPAAAYAVAATVAYYCAVWLAIALSDTASSLLPVGIAAGLLGGGLLTGAGAALFAWQRGAFPVVGSVLAGTVLGALLALGFDGFWEALALYAPWQAGYAAALATGLTRPAG